MVSSQATVDSFVGNMSTGDSLCQVVLNLMKSNDLKSLSDVTNQSKKELFSSKQVSHAELLSHLGKHGFPSRDMASEAYIPAATELATGESFQALR